MLVLALLLLMAAFYVAIRIAMFVARRFYALRAIIIGIMLIVVAGLVHALTGFENTLLQIADGKQFSPASAAIYWVHVVILVAGWSIAPCVGWLFGRRVKGANNSLKADGPDGPRL
jgi:hypothetical protein